MNAHTEEPGICGLKATAEKAGRAGRFLAQMLGTEPRTVLLQDLKRMKILFENEDHLLRELDQSEAAELLKTAGC